MTAGLSYSGLKQDVVSGLQQDTGLLSGTPTAMQAQVAARALTAGGLTDVPDWVAALIAPDSLAWLNSRPSTAQTPTFYYHFPQTAPAYFDAKDIKEFRSFTAQQQTATKQVLTYISSVANLRFVETNQANGLDVICFSNNEQKDSGGYALYPGATYRASDVFIGWNWLDEPDWAFREGSYAAYTIMHEVGHALGLRHPFATPDSYGNSEAPPFLYGEQNSSKWTMMAYDPREQDQNLKYAPLDIAALQYLYGPPQTTPGNDVYHLDPAQSNFIADSGGVDTIDGSNIAEKLFLQLQPGLLGWVGENARIISDAGSITVNYGTLIENAAGGSGADLIIGNSIGNMLQGNDGNDTLDGGDGIDTAVFRHEKSQYQIPGLGGNLHDLPTFGVYGVEGQDVLSRIERLKFQDKFIACDIHGNAGQAYRLYQAAFDRKPDLSGLGFWIAAMDNNTPLKEVAQGFVASAEFIALYGKQASNDSVVTALYQNVLHRAPDAGGKTFWLDVLQHGASVAEVLAAFSESPENQAQVIGAIQGGIEFIPYI